ncbi:hypothetical protein JTB14_010295 [Gonioctena quinquepunctata]|nr:hypothetical protein JTB14_010295 [Gonioctena quinquepunctata]
MATMWTDIMSFLKEDPALKTWLNKDDEEAGIQDIDVNLAKNWQRVLAYQGFDVKRVYKAIGKLMVSHEQAGLSDTVSKALLCPNFTSCIPILLFFLIQLIVDDVIHRGDENITNLDDMFNYYRAAYDSLAMPSVSTVKYCTSIAVANVTNNGFSTPIVQAAILAEDKMRSRRPNDAALAKFIQNLEELKV